MTRRFKFRVLFILLALFAVAVPMAVTYTTSYSIAELNKQKLALEAQASAERSAIRVLQAEWAYLAEPSRIERLAAQHLKMNKGGATQVAEIKNLNTVLAMRTERPPLPSGEVVAQRRVRENSTQLAQAIPQPAAPVKVAVAARPPSAVRRSPSTPDTVQLVLASFRAQ
jgi:cell division protein FtsL